MSVARSASATTSLPKPAALTPAGTGRSMAARPAASLDRFLTGSFLLLATDAPLFAAPGRMSGHPTGLRDRLQIRRAYLEALIIRHFSDPVAARKGELPPDCHRVVSNLCSGCSQACSPAPGPCQMLARSRQPPG